MSSSHRLPALTGRTTAEARFAATLLRAAGTAPIKVPPTRFGRLALDVAAYGPAGSALSAALTLFPRRTALVDERHRLTFAELAARSDALAAALTARGFRPGDCLGILARNHSGFYVALFAGSRLGARTVLLNTDFAGPQLADVCRREGVSVLLHDEEFTELTAHYEAPLGSVLTWAETSTAASIGDLVEATSARRLPRPERRQRIVLLTSGTTGTPKGAPREMAVSLVIPGGYLSKIPLRAGRAVVMAAPAFHAWGLLSSVVSLGLGNTLVLSRRFDPAATLAAIDRHRADALITVPVLLGRLLELGAEAIGAYDLDSLRIIGVSGSALAPDLAARAMDTFGDILYNLYGSTECAYATIATPADLRAAPGTVGRPPFGTTIRLLDEDDHDVPAGATGRIFVGNSIQFEGYTGGGGKPMIDGLMSTGDVGHLDAAGRLFIDGRDDDMLISGGENVFPREIEDLLAAHPGVLESAVVGVPDEQFGSRLRAYVVPRPGMALDEDAVRDYVRANLARYKVPREVRFLETLPRNPAGKVLKRELPN